jgi:hypothetical protein
MRPEVTLDIETYVNYFLVMFRRVTSGQVIYFEQDEFRDLDKQKILKILKNYTIVGFNSINYDMPMLKLAMRGANNEELKTLSDRIIGTELLGWQTDQMYESV